MPRPAPPKAGTAPSGGGRLPEKVAARRATSICSMDPLPCGRNVQPDRAEVQSERAIARSRQIGLAVLLTAPNRLCDERKGVRNSDARDNAKAWIDSPAPRAHARSGFSVPECGLSHSGRMARRIGGLLLAGRDHAAGTSGLSRVKPKALVLRTEVLELKGRMAGGSQNPLGPTPDISLASSSEIPRP
jgi:hypothetical protein